MMDHGKMFDIDPRSLQHKLEEYDAEEDYYQSRDLEFQKAMVAACREKIRNIMDTLHELPQNTLLHIVHDRNLIHTLRDDEYKSMQIDVYNRGLAGQALSEKQKRVLVNIICNP